MVVVGVFCGFLRYSYLLNVKERQSEGFAPSFCWWSVGLIDTLASFVNISEAIFIIIIFFFFLFFVLYCIEQFVKRNYSAPVNYSQWNRIEFPAPPPSPVSTNGLSVSGSVFTNRRNEWNPRLWGAFFCTFHCIQAPIKLKLLKKKHIKKRQKLENYSWEKHMGNINTLIICWIQLHNYLRPNTIVLRHRYHR